MVMGGHLLHPELTADASGAARAHSLQENVDLDEAAECQLLKNQVRFHHRCALLDLHRKSPSFFHMDDSYYDTTGTKYNNYNSDNRQ